MFQKLLIFEYKRTPLQAFGFYLAYLLLSLLLAFFMGILSIPFGVDTRQAVLNGAYLAMITCMVLYSLILYKKNLYKDFGYLLLLFFTGILGVLFGGLAGLIPVAFLTTRGLQISGDKLEDELKSELINKLDTIDLEREE